MRMLISLILLFIVAFLCALATILEAKFNTSFAKEYIYNAWYFHILFLFLACILLSFLYKMRKKLSIFLLHLSLIIIFIGACLTHFFAKEGIIHLKNNESTQEFLSTQTFLTFKINNKSIKNEDFTKSINLENNILDFVELSNEGSYANVLSDDLNDLALLSLKLNIDNKDYSLELRQNECALINDINLCFDAKKDKNYIMFSLENNEFFINSDEELLFKNSYKDEKITKKSKIDYGLYYTKDFSFSIIDALKSAKLGYKLSGGDLKILHLKLNKKDDIYLALNEEFKKDNISILWAQDSFDLGFKMYLKRFKVDYYESSKIAKNYKSELLVLDDDKKFDFELMVNKPLDYKGFRFFQHSFDEDFSGTYISVNKDPGKNITYLGYFLLFISAFLNLFSKEFKQLLKATLLIFLCFNTNLKADDLNSHLKILDEVLVLDLNERILPFYSYSKDLCIKLKSCKNEHSLSVFKLTSDVDFVNNARLIYVEKDFFSKLGINNNYAKFSDFYQDSKYKLSKELKNTLQKGESNFNEFDKKLVKLDERVNIFYLIFTGELFKILPELSEGKLVLKSIFAQDLSLENQKIANKYINSILLAKLSNDYKNANEILLEIKKMQQAYSSLPSDLNIKAQIFLSKINGFDYLLFAYLFLFILAFFSFKSAYFLSLLSFVCFSFLLALRAFIAGYAPFSNTYESLIYIAFVLALIMLIFRNKLIFILASLLCVCILLSVLLNEINPQITNLTPALNSIYLSIHVSVISASYSFFALSCALSFLFLCKENKIFLNQAKLFTHIALLLLLCGNFLGAIWANESWGRYWGWDSKETWTLVSILFYSIVLHLKYTKIYSDFLYALLNFYAFNSILMTYFGVNYFLNGKHSYAGFKSEFIYYKYLILYVILILILSLIFIYKRKKKCKN